MSRIGIFGAGSVGCAIGARLAATGADVVMIGRQRLADEIAAQGLGLTDYLGARFYVPASQARYTTSAQAASDADVVLVTVKSAATQSAAQELAAVLKPGALVISFQNGIGNAELLAAALPQHLVLAGMVPYNATSRGPGEFHQGTEGTLVVQRHARLAAIAADFARAGIPLQQRGDIAAVQWAKLLLNLNNPINALAGLPLKAQLSQRDYRRCLALVQDEALAVLDAAGIKPARLTPLPPHWMPRLLCVPDFIFKRIAGSMLKIDPLARSSMLDDLQLGRRTEIDWIHGAIVKLAERLSMAAPANARLIALIRDAEAGGKRDWSAAELLLRLTASSGPMTS
ncbi:MAG: 2-dehydropantoate 2-reductase [Hydrocarboniphaga sp.]|uniref:2-dehydropantoate 2-reductase n=1 Tax=Hydrocarboniphaga sp. TaxID=2033016 RepID=UPI0026293494|nr:2-dehydropantoate 2-reductase [Hydrocarboniphaga sp.]MDB5972948.1 2-dehydropantoate 2-reductase [Hydrocarboniphaga sp.]